MSLSPPAHEGVPDVGACVQRPERIDPARNSAIGLAYNVFSLSGRIVLFAALPRLIPYAPLGRYFYIIAVVALVTKFLDWGSAGMVQRFIIPMYHIAPEKIRPFLHAIGVHKILLVGVVVLLGIFAYPPDQSQLEFWAIIAAATALTFASLAGKVLYSADQFLTLRGTELSYQLLQPALVVALFFILGPAGVPTAVVVSTLVLLGLNTAFSWKHVPDSAEKRYRWSREEIRFGLVVYLGNMAFTEFPSVTVALINWVYPEQPAVQAIAGVAVALSLRMLVQFCSFIPSSTENYVMQIGTLGSTHELSAAFRRQWQQTSLIAVALVVLVLVSADAVIPILLGEKYAAASEFVIAFLPASLLLTWLYLFRNYVFVVRNYGVYIVAPIVSMAVYVGLMAYTLRTPEDASRAGVLTAIALFIALMIHAAALRHLASAGVLLKLLMKVAWPSIVAAVAVLPVRHLVKMAPYSEYIGSVVYPVVAGGVFLGCALAAGLLPRSLVPDLWNRLKQRT